MAEYYKMRFGSVWFTTDGTADGEPCKVEFLSGFDELLDRVGSTGIADSGKPKTEFPLNEGRGIAVEMKFASTSYPKLADLKTLFDANEPFIFAGTGIAGNFTIGGLPHYAPQPIQRGVQMSQRMKDLIVRVITTDLPE